MPRVEFDLAQLLQPIELSTFFAHYWERRPLVISRHEPGYYADLFALSDVDHILSATDLRSPALRLVKHGSPIPLRDYTVDLPWGGDVFRAVADLDRVLQAYSQGATIILQALHRSWKPLSLLCRNLESYLNHPVQTNVYLTPKDSQGFAPHYDTHDVFVLQIAGSKHWRIYGSPILLPGRGQPYRAAHVQPGEPLQELDLQAGDLIYLPRGYIHEALTSADESLHITVGVVAYTWLDVLTEALADCQQDVRFRESLPVGFATRDNLATTLADQLRERLEVFAERANQADVVEQLAERFVMSRPALLYGQLLELEELDRLTVDSVVRQRRGIVSRVKEAGGTVALLFQGKQIKLPAYAAPALRYAVETDHFTVASMSGDLDDPGKLALARCLIREGFLTIDPA
jgi:ribosomal protein L16 Arg81 hydroxylase